MPGIYIFKPLEATISHDINLGASDSSWDPICKIKVGNQKVFSHPSKKFGTHPQWEEDLVIEDPEQSFCQVSLRDPNRMNPYRRLGHFQIDLNEIQKQGKVAKWFDILKKDKVQGQLLMEVIYKKTVPRLSLSAIPFIPTKRAPYKTESNSNSKSKEFHEGSKSARILNKRNSFIRNKSTDALKFNNKDDGHQEVEHFEKDPKSPIRKESFEHHRDSVLSVSSGMSNPNLVGCNDDELKGLIRVEEDLERQRRLTNPNVMIPFGLDKITTVNDTSLGVFSHPESLRDTGMSDLNKEKEPFRKESNASIAPFYHLEPNEIDKITTIHDTSLGSARRSEIRGSLFKY